jgi:hypothetical protein
MRLLRSALLGTAAALFGLTALPGDAAADPGGWHRGRGHWDGWRRPYYAAPAPVYWYRPAPPVFYAPPPRVYYAPPPRIYYAPPPAIIAPSPSVGFYFRF